MKVHHLDCCTMCPVAGKWVNHAGHMVAHCLVVETDSDGLVLVDTGIGTADVRDAERRLGRVFTTLVRPRCDPAETAANQVEALGFDLGDVRHIVPTHLDVDHAGGIADFPDATVHIRSAELDAAMSPSLRERSRYRQAQWAHGPRWNRLGEAEEDWFGFPSIPLLDSLGESIMVVPLPGHTRGHVLVAVREDDKWWLHCGDAYFQVDTVDPTRQSGGPLLKFFESITAGDRTRVRENHVRLRALAAAHGDEIRMFSAHDPEEFRDAIGRDADSRL